MGLIISIFKYLNIESPNMECDFCSKIFIYKDRLEMLLEVATKDGNIGFDGYIGTWILWIYHRYIGGYFYMSIDIS